MMNVLNDDVALLINRNLRLDTSHVMRKPTFCICENKDADQLRGNREADQGLCFRYTNSTIPLLSKSEIFKPLAIFCSCTAWFVSDQVRDQNVGFLMKWLTLYRKATTKVIGDDQNASFLTNKGTNWVFS